MLQAQQFSHCTLDAGVYEVVEPGNRQAVSAFIKRCFAHQYQAEINRFATHLLALTDHRQQLLAALGYESAANKYLFVEQYLLHPIEIELMQRGLGFAQRNQIVEFGNLASVSSGSTRRLILSLVSYFYQQGYRWLVITITPQVLNSFFKLGIAQELVCLADASPDNLTSNDQQWGSYYDHQPRVYACNFAAAIERLKQSPLLATIVDRQLPPVRDESLQIAGVAP